MVQAEQNTTLTLKNLAPCGAVLTAEVQNALEYSIPIKRAEAGVASLSLWGKIAARNGKDYLIFEGTNGGYVKGQKTFFDSKWFYSQDGVKLLDLPAVDGVIAAKARALRSPLTGDAAQEYTIEEPDPAAADAPPPAEGEEAEPKKLVFKFKEEARLRAAVEAIAAATSILPAGCMALDAGNKLVPAKLWSGAEHPDKLEAYCHRASLPDGATLAADVRGTWALHYDSFKAVATLRSLLFPGFFFFYSARDASWGGLYSGDGNQNTDLVFML